MIFVKVIYVTLINLTNGMYSTTTIELSISLLMYFRKLNFAQIKMIFRGYENLKEIFIANVNVCRCSNLIKLINILEQTAVLL